MLEFGRNGFNLLCEEDLIVNELEKDVEYNGWWYCAMVLENKKNELPLPFFIHIDDIAVRKKDRVLADHDDEWYRGMA